MSKRATQKDVAKKAKVSQTTVSLVVNNPNAESISESTKKKVLDAIRELDYVPDKNAIGLRTNKNHAIAAIIPDIANPFYPSYLRGVQKIAREFGYDLLIYDTNRNPDLEKQAIQSLAAGHVDGAILMLFFHKDEEVFPLLGSDLKLITVRAEKPPENYPVDSVYIDNFKAAQAAVEFFLNKGHTRIALLSGLDATPPQVCRQEGFRSELEKNQIEIPEHYVQVSDFTDEGGYLGMKALLEKKPVPTAVFAVDDLMAIGAMRAIKEFGLRIPEDVAILGFDDIPAARLVSPPLSTIAQHERNLGEQAALRLFQRMDASQDLPQLAQEFPVEIIIRDST